MRTLPVCPMCGADLAIIRAEVSMGKGLRPGFAYTYHCRKCGFTFDAVDKLAYWSARREHEQSKKVPDERFPGGGVMRHRPCPMVLVNAHHHRPHERGYTALVRASEAVYYGGDLMDNAMRKHEAQGHSCEDGSCALPEAS